jgi:N-methylhydantoinase A/oxoprolinase/acetone carboxylase beta subunit
MHACEIAKKLDIATVLVPRHAGVLSALGMLVADVTRDYSATVLRASADLSPADLRAYLRPLCVRATEELRREGYTGRRVAIEQQLDVRYVGQSFEITLPLSDDYREEFDRRHGRLYGYSNPHRAVEVVAARVRASGITEKPALPFTRPRRASRPKPAAVRPGRFDGRACQVAHYRWPDLSPGAAAPGPAVIAGAEATTVIPPGFRFRVDGFGNIIAGQRSLKSGTRS